MRFEVTLPRGVAARVAYLWRQQGVRELSVAAARDADLLGAGGTARTVFEVLLLPRFLHKATLDLFKPLPQLLLHYLCCGLLWLLAFFCPDKCRDWQAARADSQGAADSSVKAVITLKHKA